MTPADDETVRRLLRSVDDGSGAPDPKLDDHETTDHVKVRLRLWRAAMRLARPV